MQTICATCRYEMPAHPGTCPHCGAQAVIAHERGVAVGGDVIDSIIITGDVEGDLYIERQFEVQAPPKPRKPPDVTGFTGRVSAIAQYTDCLQQSHFAAITGMAGVGKTWLAAALVMHLGVAEKTFWHSFYAGESAENLFWKLAGFLYRQGQTDLWRTLDITRQTGGRLPPLEVLSDSLLQILRYQDYLLVLDDFQFVDQDPILVQFCQRLRNQARGGHTALLITSRRMPRFVLPSEFDPLPGLDIADTRAVFDHRGILLPEPVLAQLHSYTGGNAGLLNLAATVIERAPDADLTRVVARLVQSDDVDDYLCQVHDSLSPAEQGLMEAVAILLGYPGTRAAIEYIWEQRARQPLRELIRLNLLIASRGAADTQYQQHAIVQDFYYDLLRQVERERMHLRAAEFYERSEVDEFKAALHYQRAGEDARAARLVTGDVVALLDQGYGQPLRHLLSQFDPKSVPAELWARTRIALGLIQGRAGDVQAAKESFMGAFSVLENLPRSPARRAAQGQACLRIGELLRYETPQEAITWLRRGLQIVADDFPEQSAELRLIFGSLQAGLGHYDEALAAVEQAMRLLPKTPYWMHIDALIVLGNVYSYRGDISQGVEYTRRALKLSKQMAAYFHAVTLLNNLSLDLFYGGDWPGGIARAQEALSLVSQWGGLKQRVALTMNTGWMNILTGDDQQAEDLLNTSLELSQQHRLREFELSSYANLADLSIRQGKIETAEACLGRAEQLAQEIEMESELPEIYRLRALIHLAKAQVEAAREAIENSLYLALEMENPFQEGISLRVLGQVHYVRGEDGTALQAFKHSLYLLVDDPYETARTQTQWGLVLLSGSEPEGGQKLLNQAQETFQRLGARRDLTFIERILKDGYPAA